MNYDSIVLTLIFFVELYDVLLEHKKQSKHNLKMRFNRLMRKIKLAVN